MTMLRLADSAPGHPLAAIGGSMVAGRCDRADARHAPPREERRAARAILAIFIEAASALITQFVEVGISDHADIARRLNRRGFPCWGRARWTAGTVAKVMRHKARLDESL